MGPPLMSVHRHALLYHTPDTIRLILLEWKTGLKQPLRCGLPALTSSPSPSLTSTEHRSRLLCCRTWGLPPLYKVVETRGLLFLCRCRRRRWATEGTEPWRSSPECAETPRSVLKLGAHSSSPNERLGPRAVSDHETAESQHSSEESCPLRCLPSGSTSKAVQREADEEHVCAHEL